MLKLWGRLSSLNVQKVVWCAGELGVPIERIDAGGSFGGLDTAESLRRNPNRKIPVIDDDGFVLRRNQETTTVRAGTPAGLLYGMFQVLRLGEAAFGDDLRSRHPPQ